MPKLGFVMDTEVFFSYISCFLCFFCIFKEKKTIQFFYCELAELNIVHC